MTPAEAIYYSKHWTQRDKERSRMEKLFPLFTFHWTEDEKGHGCYAQMGRSKQYLSGDHRRMEEALTTAHRLQSIEADLSKSYPSLIFLALESHASVRIDTWVKAKSSGGCGTGALSRLSLAQPDLHTILANLNAEAEKSLQDGWFYCSGHERAEPQDNYSYFYFTGKYCKEYAEANPSHQRAAGRETYE
jgi:hypothetical protein